MALPDATEIKAYLRVTTDVEDDLFTQIELAAKAWVRSFYQVPLDLQDRTFYGLWPKIGNQRQDQTRLIVPVIPCETSATITDRDGATVDSSTYRIDPRTGYVEAKVDVFFSNPPYDIRVDVGWATHPDYDDNVEPILRQAILWAASTYYRNRNVAAVFEQSGGQVSITYTEKEIPPLLFALMKGLKASVWFAA